MTEPHAPLDPRLRELLGVLAHELRTPIGSLLGFEELISEGIYGTVDDQARDGLTRMRYAAKQLLQLVDGMSDLALHQHGAHPPNRTLTDIAPLLHAAVRAQRPDAEARHTTLELSADDDLAPVHTDPERAARALQLALGAAIKTTHSGHLHLTARKAHRAAILEISGSGLAPGKDDPERSERLSGAGLRIAMARTALVPVRGTVTLRPRRGAGTTLRLRLPSLGRLTLAPRKR